LGVPLLFTEEFEVVIMIAVKDRRDAWVGPSPDLNIDYERAWVGRAKATASTRAKWRSSTSACWSVLEKLLDTADIVREAI
jgi:hypothetical protein